MQLPREEFEARVRRAALAGEALKNPPRLLEARYRATLVDTALVGTSQWTVLNPTAAAGILPLAPLNLALRGARLDHANAILGTLDGKTLGLLVEQPGQHRLFLDWSSRGDPAPDGLHFELRLPACALTTLELDLPADHVVTVYRDTFQLSGPHPADAPDRRLWRIECAGRSQMHLVLRRVTKPGPPPLVLAQLQTTQTLAPDLLEAEFVFHLEVLHHPVRELVFACDPVLKPIQVTLRNRELESWEVRPSTAPGAPATLVIRLREPVQGALQSLRIFCHAPLPAQTPWTCPGLFLVGAVPRGETLVLRVPASLRLEEWQPGGFHLSRATTDPSGRQVLTLTGSGPSPDKETRRQGDKETRRSEGTQDTGGDPAAPSSFILHPSSFQGRPRARLTAQGPEYRARQLTWWRVGPDSSSLRVQLTYEVTRGQLFQVPVLLPPGWELDGVEELGTPGWLRHWTVLSPEADGVPLLLDLHRPLGPAPASRWTVQLRLKQNAEQRAKNTAASRATAADPAAPGELVLAFPDVLPQGARLREGTLALSVDPSFQATPSTRLTSVAPEPAWEPGSATSAARLDSPALSLPSVPWAGQPVDHAYRLRGWPAGGSLRLRVRRPQVRAHCSSKVVLASGRAAVLARLTLQPEAGSPDVLDVDASTPVLGAWHWKTEQGKNGVRSVQRLHAVEAVPHLLALGTPTALGAVSLLAQPLRGTVWRLTLEQPLREPLVLEATLDLPGQEAGPPAREVGSRGSPSWLAATLGTAATPWSLGPLSVAPLVLVRAPGATLPRGTRDRRWEVPLLTVRAAQHMEGEVTLHLAGADLVRVETAGLREVTAGARAGASSPWRTFRYSQAPLALVLHGQVPAADRSAEAVVDQAELHTYVDANGQLVHHYRFEVWNWRQRALPVRLPAGARPLAARVDGKWVSRLALAGPVDSAPLIELPVTGGPARLHRFTVVYATDVPAWRLWARLEASAPVLPVRTVAFRRVWHLPPGLAPLAEGAYQRLPGPGEPRGRNGEQGDSLLRSPLSRWPFGPEEGGARPRLLLAETASAWRDQPGAKSGWRLGDALESLAFETLRGREPLVLDAAALREAGLGPQTPFLPGPGTETRRPGDKETRRQGDGELAGLPWEDLGLVDVPGGAAALLTTRRQREAWQDTTGLGSALPAAIEEAIAEAAVHGQDRSGRFRGVADWLREAESGGPNAASSPEPLPMSWGTEWEPLAGAPEEALVVVRQDVVAGAALALAGLLVLAGWQACRASARRGLGLLLSWLAVGGLALVWMPAALHALVWWPTLLAGAWAISWYLWTAILVCSAPRWTEKSTATSAALALLLTLSPCLLVSLSPCLFASPCLLAEQAPAPDPFTVWLVPGPNEAPEKQAVLVAPELLDQLQALARRGAGGLQGAALLSATYDGSVAGAAADFTAVFLVHCFGEAPASLALPLGIVQLQEARVDGALAYPVPLPAPRVGYALRVQGPGLHKVQLRFTARVQGAGEERELRFAIPEVAQSQLTLHAPASARYLQTVGTREGGAQQVQADAGGSRLHADLGRVATLHARWRQESAPAGPATVQVKEAYLWDLQPTASRLLCLLQYTVSQGAPTAFTLRLPEQLEVRRVEPPTALSGAGPTPRLKDWLLSGTGRNRRLRFEFQAPVTDGVQLLLELVPRVPLGPRAALLLPTPQEPQAAEGLLAYRVDGFEVRGTPAHLRVTGISPEEFHRPWQAAGVDDLGGPPERAYSFRRRSGAGPSVALDLDRPAACARCVQDISWRVGPRQADLQVTARLTAPEDDDLILVEWEVPADVEIVDVQGAEVRNWSRTGARVQVWLQRALDQTTLELTGWLPRTRAETRQQGGEQTLAPFALPCLRFVSTREQTTFVRVSTDGRLALDPTDRQHLLPLPDTNPSDQGMTYVAIEPTYGATFQVRPAAANVVARLFTVAEVRDRSLTFATTVECRARHGELRTLTVRLADWEGADVRLEAPPPARPRPPRRDRVNRTWTWVLDLPPGAAGPYTLTLTGSVPLEAAEPALPDVHVEGTASQERWLALAGSELGAEDPRGLALVEEPGEDLHGWAAVQEPLRWVGAVWKVEADDWQLPLRPAAALAGARPVQVLLVEQSAALLDGRHWGHEATYWLYYEAGTDLTFRLPAGTAVLTVTVDGHDVTPLQRDGKQLWLPLTGGSGVRVVRLSWTCDARRERLDRPNLDRPRLEGTEDGRTLWTVHVPAGYRLRRIEGPAQAAHAAGQDLRRAAAHLRLSTLLAEQALGDADSPAGQQLRAAQERFYRSCRQAEYRLAQAVDPLDDRGLDGQSLADWLQGLREANQQQAREQRFEKIRALAEKRALTSTFWPPVAASVEDAGGASDLPAAAARGSLLPERGTPTHWWATTLAPAPRLHLEAEREQQVRQSWAVAGVWLIVLLGVWVVSYCPRILAWVWATWPEQMVVLGVVGWQLLGVSLLAVCLIWLGLSTRLFYFGRWALGLRGTERGVQPAE
jgi:hypothetical protein